MRGREGSEETIGDQGKSFAQSSQEKNGSGLYRHRDGRIYPPQRARRRKMARRTKREMLQKQASPRAATRQPDETEEKSTVKKGDRQVRRWGQVG